MNNFKVFLTDDLGGHQYTGLPIESLFVNTNPDFPVQMPTKFILFSQYQLGHLTQNSQGMYTLRLSFDPSSESDQPGLIAQTYNFHLCADILRNYSRQKIPLLGISAKYDPRLEDNIYLIVKSTRLYNAIKQCQDYLKQNDSHPKDWELHKISIAIPDLGEGKVKNLASLRILTLGDLLSPEHWTDSKLIYREPRGKIFFRDALINSLHNIAHHFNLPQLQAFAAQAQIQPASALVPPAVGVEPSTFVTQAQIDPASTLVPPAVEIEPKTFATQAQIESASALPPAVGIEPGALVDFSEQTANQPPLGEVHNSSQQNELQTPPYHQEKIRTIMRILRAKNRIHAHTIARLLMALETAGLSQELSKQLLNEMGDETRRHSDLSDSAPIALPSLRLVCRFIHQLPVAFPRTSVVETPASSSSLASSSISLFSEAHELPELLPPPSLPEEFQGEENLPNSPSTSSGLVRFL